MTFTTSLDESAKKKTAAITIIFMSSCFSYFLIYHKQWIFPACVLGIFLLLLLVTYLFKPYKYEITQNNILVYRLIGKVVIYRKDITSIHQIHNDLLRNTTKGGAFGYFGKFNTDIGKTVWYGTRKNKIVLITTKNNDKIVLTPDKWIEFIQEFSN